MATTIFVALQCCQCSTMQVKQRKKSSNKWMCVVCNQKQSVVKVFAQGPMAKDLRKFVQSFNMSRKFADNQNQNQNQPFDHPTTSDYDINFEDDVGGGGDLDNPKKRRTDWTEYLDPEDHKLLVSQEEEQGDDLEPQIVTELPPKEKFKRPKSSNYEIGESTGDRRNYFKPVFSKRNSRNDDTMLISQDDKAVKQQQSMGNVGNFEELMSEWKAVTAKGNSKWKDYITEDDGGPTKFADHMNKWGDAVLKTETNYQMVEDDIHPDFM